MVICAILIAYSRSMIITLGNQKGGVGKTTLVLLLANWLVSQGRKVIVLDADRQLSAYNQRENDKKSFSSEEFPYPILRFSLDRTQEEIYDLLEKLDKDNPDVFILVDTPGNLSVNGLVPCFLRAQVIICPFLYERKSLDSTGTFIVVLKRLFEGMKAPTVVFVPNCVRLGVGTKEEKEVFEQVKEAFSSYGVVTPFLKDLAAVKRVNSFSLFKDQQNAVEQCFGKLIEVLCQR